MANDITTRFFDGHALLSSQQVYPTVATEALNISN